MSRLEKQPTSAHLHGDQSPLGELQKDGIFITLLPGGGYTQSLLAQPVQLTNPASIHLTSCYLRLILVFQGGSGTALDPSFSPAPMPPSQLRPGSNLPSAIRPAPCQVLDLGAVAAIFSPGGCADADTGPLQPLWHIGKADWPRLKSFSAPPVLLLPTLTSAR